MAKFKVGDIVCFNHKNTHSCNNKPFTIEHSYEDNGIPIYRVSDKITCFECHEYDLELYHGNNHLADVRKMVDWEQRRYEIAKEVLPIVYRESLGCVNVGFKKRCAQTVIIISDALIEELKETSKHKG